MPPKVLNTGRYYENHESSRLRLFPHTAIHCKWTGFVRRITMIKRALVTERLLTVNGQNWCTDVSNLVICRVTSIILHCSSAQLGLARVGQRIDCFKRHFYLTQELLSARHFHQGCFLTRFVTEKLLWVSKEPVERPLSFAWCRGWRGQHRRKDITTA